MNRRSFLSRCLAGAVLGLARNLPMPAVGQAAGLTPVPDPIIIPRAPWVVDATWAPKVHGFVVGKVCPLNLRAPPPCGEPAPDAHYTVTGVCESRFTLS